MAETMKRRTQMADDQVDVILARIDVRLQSIDNQISTILMTLSTQNERVRALEEKESISRTSLADIPERVAVLEHEKFRIEGSMQTLKVIFGTSVVGVILALITLLKSFGVI